MKSSEIRTRFFTFFSNLGHEKVASSSLIPAQDPTLLFTNAGMNQFKDLFLGLEKRNYTRAVSIQKCVRAGGKHNDLDNVGFTKRHLTFFEMMGNFSFNDYFKKEAIRYAWDFLTKELSISSQFLHVSVFFTDDESYAIWLNDIKLPAEKIHRLGEEENFWAMGDTGPCGPCTEIHIDRGPTYGCADGTDCGPACVCDRFLEIWNVVFMQFDRQIDGTLKELKQKGVDTGMGLERLSAVMQDRDSVFQTDLFTPLIARIEEITKIVYAQQKDDLKAAFHVLADHARSATLLINDGAAPSNDGRGYVLRKIIRRAALFAEKLSNKHELFPDISRAVIEELKEYYPDLVANATLIYEVLMSEIEKFAHNLVRGKAILTKYFQESVATKKITGAQAFKMYDTYGFPLELIVLISQEHGYTVDNTEFDAMMRKQQMQSGKKQVDPLDSFELDESIQTVFTGYTELSTVSTISALICNDMLTDRVVAGATCWLITPKSPFFIVGGGQVPDTGWIVIEDYKIPVLSVRFINGRIAVYLETPIDIKIGASVKSEVNREWRTYAMKNHTATHLLQAALIEILGRTVKQSGSLVHPDYLRFDFTYHENISDENCKKIEALVNQKIQENIPVSVSEKSMREAVKEGALAFFGDKYNPDKVRVIGIDNFSIELCGGTHVNQTGAIGAFKIIETSALSAGHRRIVAVTGPAALALFQETFNAVKQLSQEFKVKRDRIVDSVITLKSDNKKLKCEVAATKTKLWLANLDSWLTQVKIINSLPFLYVMVENASGQDLKDIAALISQKQNGFVFVINGISDKISGMVQTLFFAQLSDQYKCSIDLKQLADWLKKTYNLSGGSMNNSIRGGGDIKVADMESNNVSASIGGWLKKHAQ